jgi:hypothetical protein
MASVGGNSPSFPRGGGSGGAGGVSHRWSEVAMPTSDPHTREPRRTPPLLATVIFGGALVGVGSMFWPFLAPAMRRIALPYIPASGEQVANVVKALKLRPRLQGARMVDVGSGDGRLVVAAAKVCGLYVSMVGWVGGG